MPFTYARSMCFFQYFLYVLQHVMSKCVTFRNILILWETKILVTHQDFYKSSRITICFFLFISLMEFC